MCYQSVVLFWCIICPSFASVVKFLPTTTFNLPSNFRDEKLPCSRETVIFPEMLTASIRLESEISVNGLILPSEGDIILADATIIFGADESDGNCSQGNTYYMERGVATWSQPDVWSSPRFNDATPDAERVPCFDDIVEFPEDAEFTITLPDQTQFISGIKCGDLTCRNIDDVFYTYRKLQYNRRFILNSFITSGLRFEDKPCRSRSGCPCQKNSLKIECGIKYCSVPTCVAPIKPEGHCCKICGGVIAFDIDQTFDIMMFRELVEKTIESYGMDSLVYHIGRLPNDKIQLVVVDKGEYSGTSAEVVNAINHQIKEHWVKGSKLVDLSGSPLYKSGLGWKIFVYMFFLVVLVMGGIYVYYYKIAEVSDVRFPILRRHTHGAFSRFQSRTDSVVCLTRRDSEAPMGRSAETAFRNPLYDSTRQRAEVAGTDRDE